MTVTHTHMTSNVAGLTPAGLAEAELDQLERMVLYVTRGELARDASQLDQAYCKKRLRTLVQTCDLAPPQRQRIILLLDRLEREALFRARPRMAVSSD